MKFTPTQPSAFEGISKLYCVKLPFEFVTTPRSRVLDFLTGGIEGDSVELAQRVYLSNARVAPMAFKWIKNALGKGGTAAAGPLPQPQVAPNQGGLASLIENGDPTDPATLEKIALGLGQTEFDRF